MAKKSATSSSKSYQEFPVSSLSQTLTELKSPDKCAKGEALEFLAIRLSQLLDLDFKGWLLRSADSNNAVPQKSPREKRAFRCSK
jgi:hypothetical protein